MQCPLMSIEGSTIPSNSILAGSPDRPVYEIRRGIALKDRATVRDYETTQCVVRILGDGNLLWESAPLTNENKTVKPQRFFNSPLQRRRTGARDRGIGKTGYAPYVVWIRPEFGKR